MSLRKNPDAAHTGAQGPAATAQRRKTRAILSEAAWRRLCAKAPAWEAYARRIAVLEEIWGEPIHVPAVHREPWRQIPPGRSRRMFMRVPHPVSIRESRPVPVWIRVLPPLRQLRAVGQACLDSIEALRPRLHRSLGPGGELVETTGTTVVVTALDYEDEDVLVVPWSVGEHWGRVVRRMVDLRKEWGSPLSDEIVRATIRQWAHPILPPPQACLSVVSGLGIRNPETAPMSSGGATPLSIVVGSETMSVAWDHRVYDAGDASRFYAEFFPRIEGATGEPCASTAGKKSVRR